MGDSQSVFFVFALTLTQNVLRFEVVNCMGPSCSCFLNISKGLFKSAVWFLYNEAVLTAS